MLKKELMNELNNENHYTVPRYVLSYAKELGLDMDSLILLIYFLNKPNKSIFDYKKIIEDINFTEKELLNALSTLKDKNILLILMEKNDSGVLEEKVDISLFYEIIFSKILNKETKENNEKDLYDNFEKEFKEHNIVMRSKGKHSNKTDEELLGVYEFQKIMYLDFIKMFANPYLKQFVISFENLAEESVKKLRELNSESEINPSDFTQVRDFLVKHGDDIDEYQANVHYYIEVVEILQKLYINTTAIVDYFTVA